MGEPLPSGDFGEILKDGVVLCKLMNKLQPGSVKKFKEKVGIDNIIVEIFLVDKFYFEIKVQMKKWGVPEAFRTKITVPCQR